MSLLHEVAACGDIERLLDLLEQPKQDKDEKDEDWEGRTPLFWAVIAGHLRCVKALVRAGANPTIQNDEDKTAAHYAAESGQYEMLKLLIEYGCDVTASDKYGDTPMSYALLYGNLECAELISKAIKGEINRKKQPGFWLDPNYEDEELIPTSGGRGSGRKSKHSFHSLMAGLKEREEQKSARRRKKSGGQNRKK